jgi:competence protein ComEC
MKRPLALAAAGFTGGLYAAARWDYPILVAAVLFLLAVLAGIRRIPLPHRQAHCLVFFFALTGALYWDAWHFGPREDALSRFDLAHPDTAYELEGTVNETGVLLPPDTSVRFVLQVDRAVVGDKTLPLQGCVSVRWSEPAGPVFVGERLRVAGSLGHRLGPVNFGVRGIEDYLRAKGVYTETRVKGDDVTRLAAPHASIGYALSWLRQRQADRLMDTMPESALPFVLAVWLGDTRHIDRAEYQAYVNSGTAHILSVSGVHVAIVAMSIGFLLRVLRTPRRVRAALIIGFGFAYAVLVGAQAASVRSAIMLAMYLAADLVDREPDAPTALSLSAMLLLLYNPNQLFDPGFLLSFGSVASILLFNDPVTRAFRILPRWLRSEAALSVSAMLLTIPLVAVYFHVVTPVAPFANAIVVGLLTFVLWICLAVSLCLGLFPAAAALFGHALQPLIFLIRKTAEYAASAPGGHFPVSSPPEWSTALYWLAAGILAAAAYSMAPQQRRFYASAALFAVAIACWVFQPLRAGVDFLDVGHSDAAFVRTPGGTTLLIDGGNADQFEDLGRDVVEPFLRAHGIQRLDYVIATHAEGDHMGGLLHIVRNFPVRTAILGGAPSNHALEAAFLSLCAERKVPVLRVKRGDRLRVAGAEMEVLHPSDTTPIRSASLNNTSLALRLVWPGVSVLFAGDVEAEAERTIARGDCRADVLKTPHHGSATSSTAGFLDAVAPRHAVVSTKVFRQHSAMDAGVRDRYTARGIRLWRTDLEGGVRIEREGKAWVLRGARGAHGFTPDLPVPLVAPGSLPQSLK